MLVRSLRRLWTRPWWQRRLALEAWMAVWVLRLALWLLPTPTLLRVVARRAERAGGRIGTLPKHLAWAVARVSRHVPHASCLTQALALQLLLARRGWPSRLHLGMGRDAAGTWQAHAWVECEGQVILGENGELGRFRPFPDLHQALSRLP